MPVNHETRSRQARAYDLRQAGWPWETVASGCGYASGGSAQYAANAHADRHGLERLGRRRTRRATFTTRRTPRAESVASGARVGRRAASSTFTMPDIAGDERRFGVEIEVDGTGPNASTIANRLVEAGILAYAPGYSHAVSDSWKVVSDATCGLEVVSPVLVGNDAGFAQVRKVMQVLKEIGCTIRASYSDGAMRCGMHVHHDANDLDAATMANLVNLYFSSHDRIDRLVAPSRRRGGSGYNKALTAGEAGALVEYFLGGWAPGNRVRAGVARERSINFLAYNEYGTVEIRQHQGTLNPTKAIAWIKFGQALVRAAAAGTDRVDGSMDDLLASLQATAGLDEAAAAYLAGRAAR